MSKELQVPNFVWAEQRDGNGRRNEDTHDSEWRKKRHHVIYATDAGSPARTPALRANQKREDGYIRWKWLSMVVQAIQTKYGISTL